MDHQESIIEMEGKFCYRVVSILIDPGSNYSYVNPDLVDNCGLRKRSACRVLIDEVGYR